MTSNHNYNTPSEGVIDWHVPLNENFRRIDADVEIRDIEENLDQYTPKQGAKFLATNTGTRYVGDGSNWDEIPPHPSRETIAPHRTSDPADAEDGVIWYRSDTDELRIQMSTGPVTLAPVSAAEESPGNALVQNPLDTMSQINDFFTETQTNRSKVDAVSAPATEGSGAMRIDQPSKSVSESQYGGNEFYGTEGFHYLDERPEYPDDGLSQCHIRYYAMLDENYTIDNPWAGQQAGKGFPGFDGRWGRDASENRRPWLVNGAIWRGDEIGESRDKWCLSVYMYDKKTNVGSSGRTYHPDWAMDKGQWYQIDRFIDVANNEYRQWYDGDLVIDLDSSDVAFTPNRSPFNKLYAIRNLFYYGGGWGAPDGSGNNYAYIDDIQVFDSEQSP